MTSNINISKLDRDDIIQVGNKVSSNAEVEVDLGVGLLSPRESSWSRIIVLGISWGINTNVKVMTFSK